MTGHFLKLLDRLGDRLTLSLLMAGDIEGLYGPQSAIRAARALKAAFDSPAKRCATDNVPRGAIFLLEHLLQHVDDPTARTEIGASLIELRDIAAKARI